MNNDRELMQQALESLSAMLTHMGMDEDDWNKPTFNQCRKAEAALRERLAQPEQEPVAWGVFDGPNLHDVNFTEEEAQEMMRLKGDGSVVKPLYTDMQPQMQPCAGRNCGSTNPNLHSAECFEDYEKATGMEQPEQKPVAWQRIETAPKTGRKVILFYLNRNNFPRTVMARWLTDDEAAETDTDCVGLEGGWYECIDNWDDYTEVAIHEGEPTYWMPLPSAPTAKGKPDAA